MAFIPGSIAGKTRPPTQSGGFVPGSVASKARPNIKSGGFVPGSIAGTGEGVPKVSQKQLESSEGLEDFASRAGLADEAQRAVAKQAGENPKEIFSGGFISDAFDTLGAMQYGVVGLLKGKSFVEGVRTRQSFTDQDALGDKGIPGMVAGIALDIAFDPLTYIAPATIVSKIPGATKLLKGAKELAFGRKVTKAIEGTKKTYEAVEGGTKLGKYTAQKFQWMFGADPIFKETFERGLKNTAIETQGIVNLAKGVAKLAPQTAAKILTKDKTGRFIRTPLAKLILDADELAPVAELYQKIDDLGREAVDLGLLSKSKYEENIGEYIKNAYTEYEQATTKGAFGVSKVGVKGIKNRKEVENISEFGLTQVDNPAYLLFKSAFDLAKDVENAKMFRSVAKNFASDTAQEGFSKLPTGIKLGDLAGKYVPDNMALYLNEIIEPSRDTLAKNLVAQFKFFKVIMNPATHARNIVSNKILNYWKLGMNPLDPRVISTDVEAAKAIKSGASKWIDEARPLGYDLDTFASAEMKGLLDDPAVNAWGKTVNGWDKTKKKLGDMYQAEENWAKLSAYIFNRKHRGLDPEAAWKAAESATFNYAQVTPFVRKLRESLFGFPFITFSVKSTPLALETAYKNPKRISVIGKIKQGIESQSDPEELARERASEPSWVKDGFYIKLPIKDKEGRSAYFDMTYVLPFGDLVSGNLIERPVSRETGLPENQAVSLARKSPFINLVSELSKNQDFYGNKIWKDSDPTEKQMGDIMRHLTKTYVPPVLADQLPGGYTDAGERVQRGIPGALDPKERPDQQRTLMQELLRYVGGKVQPIDADIQEKYQEWNRQKALTSVLKENQEQTGISEFNRVYQKRR